MIPTRQLAERTKDQIVSPSAGCRSLPVGHRRLLLSLFPHLCISQPPSRKPTDSCLTVSVESQAVGIFPYCVFFFSCVRRACSSPAPVELVNLQKIQFLDCNPSLHHLRQTASFCPLNDPDFSLVWLSPAEERTDDKTGEGSSERVWTI